MTDGSFVALRYRDFRLLWFGQMISLTGTHMQRTALAWHVYLLTHDPLSLGLIGLFRAVPLLTFSLVGGLVADAHDRRRVMLWTQGAMAACAVVLAAMTFTGHTSAPVIYVVILVTAAAAAFDSPSRQSLIPNLVPRHHFTNAVSLNSIMSEVARIAGPSIGGLVIAAANVGVVYAINTASFAATIAAILLMRTNARPGSGLPTGTRQALREGLLYVRGSPVILGSMLMDFFATFFASANVLLPIMASDVLRVGPEGYGLLTSAPAVGSLLAGLVMSTRSQVRRPGVLMMWAVAAYGAATVIFGVSPVFVISLVFFAITGTSDTVSTILRQTIRQLATPDRLRGRVTSVNTMMAMGGPQLGELEAGVVASLAGAPFAVITGGIGCLLTVACVARFVPALREYAGEEVPSVDAPSPVAAGEGR